MDKIKQIKEWLDGDQNYFKGIELYNAHAIGGRRIFPIKPTCAQCHNVLKAELENILQIAEEAEAAKDPDIDEAAAIAAEEAAAKDELLKANLDEMEWPAMKSLFARLNITAASNKKVDVLAALKGAQLQLQTPE